MGGLFTQGTLEQVRAASDIVEVIGGFFPLKRAGANFVALCPFHREKSPSFHVNPHRQTFHCFGCHKGGDVFTFIKEFENVGFSEAVRRLADRARIPLEVDKNPAAQQTRELKESLLLIHEQITQRWQSALQNDAAGQIARDYLERRGVSAEGVQLFRLGYAPDSWDDTVNWAKSKGHELARVEQGGLILSREGSDGFYDRFRGRLIFPICDEQGRVVGFSGRILTGDEKTAKYVNSPETAIFTKGKIFFGLDKSKRPLLEAKCAIVCEGQLDLIACFMAGVKNIVAPQGTALTADHARILKRYVDEVVLCFDSDNAGQNAAVRSLDSLLAAGLAIRVATIPAPHDPDSLIKASGPEAFRQVIEKAQGFFDFYLDRLAAQNDAGADKGRLAILRGMSEALAKTGNSVLFDTYAQKTALRLGVSADAVRTEFRKHRARGGREREQGEEIEEDAAVAERPSQQEFWLLKLLLQWDDHVEWIATHLDPQWLGDGIVRKIVLARLAARKNWSGVAAWLTELESAAERSLVTEVLAEETSATDAQAILQGAGTRRGLLEILRDKFIDREVSRLTQQLSDTSLPPDQADALMQQKFEWRKRKQERLV